MAKTEKKQQKKDKIFLRVSEAEYRRAKRDRERLIKLKALAMAMMNLLQQIDR